MQEAAKDSVAGGLQSNGYQAGRVNRRYGNLSIWWRRRKITPTFVWDLTLLAVARQRHAKPNPTQVCRSPGFLSVGPFNSIDQQKRPKANEAVSQPEKADIAPKVTSQIAQRLGFVLGKSRNLTPIWERVENFFVS